MGEMKVPFLDLVAPHRELRGELLAVVEAALEGAAFSGGPVVGEFEQDFARYCESPYCVGVGSGTDALRFALLGAGVQPGETVVTVPLTFIATTEAISQVGARPAFVDIDEQTYTMDPEKLRVFFEHECRRDRETGRTIHKDTGSALTAVLPVHLYGQTADMDPILDLAEQYGLAVIEDACQAHGAAYFSRKRGKWYKAGSMGRAAAFSFYPGKNLGACGEAGAITTVDEELARRCRMIRDHGQSKKYCHEVEGYNGRLDAIQAGILRVKLRHLEQWNERRRECGYRYDELLGNLNGSVTRSSVPSWCRPVFHLYVIRVKERERLQRDLSATGIGTGIHYPVPLHLTRAYAYLGYREGDFPLSERVAREIFSLPMFPELTAEQQQEVVESLSRSVEAGAAVGLESGHAIPSS